jgi:hypothetical protein
VKHKIGAEDRLSIVQRFRGSAFAASCVATSIPLFVSFEVGLSTRFAGSAFSPRFGFAPL